MPWGWDEVFSERMAVLNSFPERIGFYEAHPERISQCKPDDLLLIEAWDTT